MANLRTERLIESRRQTTRARARRLSLVVLFCGAVVVVWVMLCDLRAGARPPGAFGGPPAEMADPDPSRPANVDYSKFAHDSYSHSRLPCLLCHQRTTNSPKPVFAVHQTCSGCHVQQFKDPQSGICTVCHVSSTGSALRPFPGLQSFRMKFDHARHVAGAARSAAGCTTCHSLAARGVAISIPGGPRAHATCFQCHSPQATGATGQNIASCDTCHQLGARTRTAESAPAYRVGFSHARHLAQKGLNCADCHSVQAGAVPGRQMSAPTPLQHHASGRALSCMNCHNGKRAFGGDDFSSCKRCHQGPHFYF